MIKFKIGDTVRLTAGKDKGREGKIEKIYPSESLVLVPGVNIYKKNIKGTGDVKSGTYDIPRPLSLGKVALICPKCKKLTRVGFKLVGETKVRICKKCKKEIDTK